MHIDKINDKLNILQYLGEKTAVYKYTENEKDIESVDFFNSGVVVIKYTNGKLLMYNFTTRYVYEGKSDNGADVYPLSGKSYYTGEMNVLCQVIFKTSQMHFESNTGVLIFDQGNVVLSQIK
ncbi:MAG: hypothetical protein EBS05_27570 [Proteobacteria bacterium]|nr:hypothetical protein [Pseudomonadota bacterium]